MVREVEEGTRNIFYVHQIYWLCRRFNLCLFIFCRGFEQDFNLASYTLVPEPWTKDLRQS